MLTDLMFKNTILFVIVVFYLLMVITTLVTIIIDKRDPIKSLAWIMVIILIPVGGFMFYLFFGQNIRKRKFFNQKENSVARQFKKIVMRQLYQMQTPSADRVKAIAVNKKIITLLLNNNLAPLTYNNEVTILNDGRDTFDCIKRELRRAVRYIHMEYYILRNDTIGNEIAAILMEKVKEGVEVRVIYDDVGSWSLPDRFVDRLRKAGVEIEPFMPVLFPLFASRINHRNHRKIIVIDGEVGFTGGINIADKYISGAKGLGVWRDTHIRIEGDAVMALHAIFAADWEFTQNEILEFEKYRARREFFDYTTAVQIASSGPDSDWASIMQAYFSAITKAKDHIYISTPYFMPNSAILTAIKVAAMSGVEVVLLVPEKGDSKIVHWATRSYIGELLRAGVKVYRYRDGFNHSKTLMIDSQFSSIGTVNIDVRSFEENFELTALIYDVRKSMELERYFLEDLEHADPVVLEEWQQKRKIENLYEGLARLFSPLL